MTNDETVRFVRRIRQTVRCIYYLLEVVVRLGPEFKTRDDHSGGVSLNDRNVISTFPVVGAFLAVISARFRD